MHLCEFVQKQVHQNKKNNQKYVKEPQVEMVELAWHPNDVHAFS